MLADPTTKMGGNSLFLQQAMRDGAYKIFDEKVKNEKTKNGGRAMRQHLKITTEPNLLKDREKKPLMEVTDLWTMPGHNRVDMLVNNGGTLQSMTAALATDELTTAELEGMISLLPHMIEVRSI